jgi:hypothetical protein
MAMRPQNRDRETVASMSQKCQKKLADMEFPTGNVHKVGFKIKEFLLTSVCHSAAGKQLYHFQGPVMPADSVTVSANN